VSAAISAFRDAVLLGAATSPFVLVALWLAGRARRIAPAAAFILLLVLDGWLTALGADMHLNPSGLRWNWVGKLLSIALSLAVIAFGPMTRSTVGLTWRQRNSGRAAVVTLGLIVLSALLLAESTPPNAETLFYQATMPGFAEELAYRGVLLWLIERALGVAEHGWSAGALSAGLVTAIAFGFWHGLGFQAGHVTFDGMAFFFPMLGGLGFWWLRRVTGSLVFPVLAHNGANVATYLAALWRV
jgi:uncharacterized protein